MPDQVDRVVYREEQRRAANGKEDNKPGQNQVAPKNPTVAEYGTAGKNIERYGSKGQSVVRKTGYAVDGDKNHGTNGNSSLVGSVCGLEKA